MSAPKPGIRLYNINNPYQPPLSVVSPPRQERARITHTLVALVSGTLVVPIVLFGVAYFLFPGEPQAFGNTRFWSSLLIGSGLCAITIFPFKRMLLWSAAIIGFVAAVAALFVPEARGLLFDAA